MLDYDQKEEVVRKVKELLTDFSVDYGNNLQTLTDVLDIVILSTQRYKTEIFGNLIDLETGDFEEPAIETLEEITEESARFGTIRLKDHPSILQTVIINILLKQEESLNSMEILNEVKSLYPGNEDLTGSDINSQLYRMKGKRTYFSGSPRVWTVMPTVKYETIIFNYLTSHRPTSLRDIVKHIKGIFPDATKKQINGFLYRAQKEGHVDKVQDQPPMWQLNQGF